MRLGTISEEQLAADVLAELQRQGFTTYEEVELCPGRADIVGVRGPIVAVVECKVSLSLQLLSQLLRWIGWANLIIGAHGHTKRSIAAERLCANEGIGLWSVGAGEIAVKVAPRLNRLHQTNGNHYIKERLRDDHRSGEYAKAGSSGGGYWTPFRETVRGLLRCVKEHPGIELREALKLVKHHYASESSARNAIPELVKKGVIEGIRCEGRPLRLTVDEQSKIWESFR